MGRSISIETYERELKRDKTIERIDKKFNEFGYNYYAVQPNIFQDPWLYKDKQPIRQLSVRGANKLLKILQKVGIKVKN